MKSRPILFSGPMVRAILGGSKSQTRRIIKPQPVAGMVCGFERRNMWSDGVSVIKCPCGQPGDQIWVKETFWFSEYSSPHPKPTKEAMGEGWGICYAATDDQSENNPLRPRPKTEERLRPSIFMPRWASRITLEITGVRVERLREISEADARAEGISSVRDEWSGACGDFDETLTDKQLYEILWESINGPGSWNANPWVWVVEFRRIKP
jgi:hypothetical protein